MVTINTILWYIGTLTVYSYPALALIIIIPINSIGIFNGIKQANKIARKYDYIEVKMDSLVSELINISAEIIDVKTQIILLNNELLLSNLETVIHLF